MTTSVLLSSFPAKGRRETDESHQALRDMIDQFRLATSQFNFPVTAINPTAGLLETTVELQLQDANDVRMLFGDNAARRVQVQRNSGTATGPALTNAEGVTGTAIPVSFDKGRAFITVSATSTGTVVIGFTDIDSAGLTATATATVTFS